MYVTDGESIADGSIRASWAKNGGLRKVNGLIVAQVGFEERRPVRTLMVESVLAILS